MSRRRPSTPRYLAALAAMAALVASAGPAAAERLIASISSHRVMVTSSFTGSELVLFGGIERDANTVSRRGGYDIAVTVTGPARTFQTFRKQSFFGIWVNADFRVFENAPSYLAVLSNRPLDAIANRQLLRRLQLGLDNVLLLQRASPEIADASRDDPFRQAFLQLQTDHKLYRENPTGVTFLTPALYQASIPLPAEAPIGNYEVDVKLFVDGVMIARTPSAFEVYKAGFEQVVSAAARDHGLAYGIATAMMALLTGWIASVVFRRD
jgi:uncharacterized protein (TIGR02186 family)